MYEVLVSVRLYVNHGFVASKLMRFFKKASNSETVL